MKEGIVVQRLRTHLNLEPNSFFFKYHGSRFSAGIPDLIGSWSGLSVAIETKVLDLPARDSTIIDLTKDLTLLQRTTMQKMEKGGWLCIVLVVINPTLQICSVSPNFENKFRKSDFLLEKFEPIIEIIPDNIKKLNKLPRN
jgi:hypothetical protein